MHLRYIYEEPSGLDVNQCTGHVSSSYICTHVMHMQHRWLIFTDTGSTCTCADMYIHVYLCSVCTCTCSLSQCAVQGLLLGGVFYHMLLTYVPKHIHFGTTTFLMHMNLAVLDWVRKRTCCGYYKCIGYTCVYCMKPPNIKVYVIFHTVLYFPKCTLFSQPASQRSRFQGCFFESLRILQ